jgi:hypothetical protein
VEGFVDNTRFVVIEIPVPVQWPEYSNRIPGRYQTE